MGPTAASNAHWSKCQKPCFLWCLLLSGISCAMLQPQTFMYQGARLVTACSVPLVLAIMVALRYFLRNAVEAQASEVELFLNSVPILNPLSQDEKLRLVDAFEEKTYQPGQQVGKDMSLCN